ncbi:aminotransferase class V-fold PLP-dependent enzyme [Helicobacter kayseriensis]|uniref:aminotransferase class V-fold PLP-dependent enzyme n=1 Tax=Helicobacter kayseriensis TaxID=2905877 RepID=UPI001E59B83E|nr:aminotransferase class V-fold PLP-dependent enzyme [Helicobacter kayseriensis]MCE3046742.1 aminotransferase class V-fold PLP-dependent enzyme [Helicobacter kayseriensis]MCE3047956.1 aminotransferase class V-fold PLP-dependent enzyme [Helicobacter kayseriensis]
MKKLNLFAPLLDKEKDPILQCRESIILSKKARYFDFTASGLAMSLVQKRLQKFLPFYANTHSNSAAHSILTTEVYDEAKCKIRECLGLGDDFALINVGSGSTGAIKMFQEIMGIYIPPKTKQILAPYLDHLALPSVFVGSYEHHSNEISYREGLCHLTRIPLNAEGLIDLEILKDKLERTSNQVIGSFNISSNVTGIISPYEEISQILRQKKGAIVAFDMAASSPYMNIPSTLFDACFLSPHKLLGGVGGSGLLGIKKNLIDTSLAPTFSGGGTIRNSSKLKHEFLDDIEQRQESGTPAILQLLTSALAYQLRNEVGLDLIHTRERVLTKTLISELQNIPASIVYGNLEADRLGVVSFNIGGISPYDLALELSYQYGIQTRAGCSCAGPYGCDLFGYDDELKQKPLWLRASVHWSHSLEDLEYFIESLKKAIKKLRA